MSKSLLFLFVLCIAVPAGTAAAGETDSVSGTYVLTEERTAIQVHADSMRLSKEMWGGIPPCTFGSKKLPLEQSRILVLKEDKTVGLQVKGGPYAGTYDLGSWQQGGDTINVIKEGRIVRKFRLSNDQEMRLTELVRISNTTRQEEEALFFLLNDKKYYRKINNGQKK